MFVISLCLEIQTQMSHICSVFLYYLSNSDDLLSSVPIFRLCLSIAVCHVITIELNRYIHLKFTQDYYWNNLGHIWFVVSEERGIGHNEFQHPYIQ